MKFEKFDVTESTPFLLRRLEEMEEPATKNGEIVANMTPVTTPGNDPEMHDQKDDPTAPRKD